MKTCFKCGIRKELSEFYAHPRMGDGLLGKCKECTKADVVQNYQCKRAKYAEYERMRNQRPERKAATRRYTKNRRRKFPEKTRAYNSVRRAVRNGTLKRLPCLICGNPESQAHHRDYSKPLEVEWLCFKHHREAHGQTVTATSRNPQPRERTT